MSCESCKNLSAALGDSQEDVRNLLERVDELEIENRDLRNQGGCSGCVYYDYPEDNPECANCCGGDCYRGLHETD